MEFSAEDQGFMRQAIALAAARVGLTGDNPAVGCVIVKDGVVVGEAATGKGGRPHAEEQALEIAGERARGAIAYVTLEPCAERSAGGLSCAQRLAGAKIAKVFIAADDASPLAAGRGEKVLQNAGVSVEKGLLQVESHTLYARYRHGPNSVAERRG